MKTYADFRLEQNTQTLIRALVVENVDFKQFWDECAKPLLENAQSEDELVTALLEGLWDRIKTGVGDWANRSGLVNDPAWKPKPATAAAPAPAPKAAPAPASKTSPELSQMFNQMGQSAKVNDDARANRQQIVQQFAIELGNEFTKSISDIMHKKGKSFFKRTDDPQIDQLRYTVLMSFRDRVQKAVEQIVKQYQNISLVNKHDYAGNQGKNIIQPYNMPDIQSTATTKAKARSA